MRLPWRLENQVNKIDLAARYAVARLLTPRKKREVSIQFVCGFHGQTGGPEAVASIANMLSAQYDVSFQLGATSNFNRWLSRSVKRSRHINMDADLYICDRATDEGILKKIASSEKPIIATIHGLPFSLHALSEDRAFNIFKYAQYSHFVSKFQESQYASHKAESTSFVISNPCINLYQNDWSERTYTSSVGMVGYFNRAGKNIVGNLAAVGGSEAKEILVWGNCDVQSKDKRVKFKGFSGNQKRIFNSFDVFISLSKDETFGLSVAQALSAGKECVLSNIPAHVAFSECPGVTIVDTDDYDAASTALNAALHRKAENRQVIHNFWAERFSSDVIADLWCRKIRAVKEKL
ncbi:glycosyltransferase [Kordiimonas aquimaris]|uniref:glycosyltransferase n=1 Tax=Kordiimonas aquimaris TaxID=707591 RepID=UPI0021CFDBBB|nr:glycosyltransferase [Kordiimonas aquimaris]